MIYEFKSRATGNVVMTQPVAEALLQVIGKPAGPTGIITVDQMPAAIAALRAASTKDRSNAPAGAQKADSRDDDQREQAVGLAQRAFPLIEMLERAQAGGKDVTWGV